MSDTNQKFVIAAGSIVVLLVLAFGWPTPYRYDTLRQAGGREVVMRTNRFTGNAQWSFGQGWLPKPVPEDPFAAIWNAPQPAPDPWADLAKQQATTAPAPAQPGPPSDNPINLLLVFAGFAAWIAIWFFRGQ